jgi:hypothetical protein
MNRTPFPYRPQRGVLRLGAVLTAVGGLALLGGLFAAPEQTWANFLLVSYYLLGLGLGGLVFVAFQYVTGAGWGVALRRLPEAMAALIPVASAGVAVVLLAYPALYPWAGPSPEAANPDTAFRHLWLSRPFVLLRALAYVALWILFARAIVRASRQQDEDGKVGHTDTNRRLSAAFLIVFGVTCWLSSVDWVMSLEPEWSSTVFGVYHFAGLFLGGLAAVAVLAVCLCRQGALRGVLTEEHLHDLGKLLFAFSSFWMYIWFSQYMLIWYTNNPEETSYFLRRLDGGWRPLFYLNVLLNWVVPFLVLLPRATKRSPRVLLAVALVILVGRWLDLYLMIVPPLGGGPMQTFGVVEVGLAAGALGLFLLTVFRALGKAPLVPVNDPFLVESLPHPEGGEHYRQAGRHGEDLLVVGTGTPHPTAEGNGRPECGGHGIRSG